MKKFVTAIATTTLACTGIAAMSVSAEEHEVVKHDTLWSISQEYGTSVQTLMDLNELDSTIILPGQQLTVNEEANKETNEETTTGSDTYSVVAGDTLSEIGAKYNVSVDQLMEWNNLESTLIQIGQALTIGEQANNQTSEEEKVNEAKEEQTTSETEESTAIEADEQVAEVEEVEPSTEEVDTSTEEGETMTVTATAYTAKCDGCTGITATGIDLNADPNKKVIAVDPNVIPLGTEVYVEGYGNAIAGDVGGAINGNKIDIHVPTKEEANNWGVRTVDITVLN